MEQSPKKPVLKFRSPIVLIIVFMIRDPNHVGLIWTIARMSKMKEKPKTSGVRMEVVL